jgi:hypothetical protein
MINLSTRESGGQASYSEDNIMCGESQSGLTDSLVERKIGRLGDQDIIIKC